MFVQAELSFGVHFSILSLEGGLLLLFCSILLRIIAICLSFVENDEWLVHKAAYKNEW